MVWSAIPWLRCLRSHSKELRIDLPALQGDSFGRMVAAQARAGDIAVVSTDIKLDELGTPGLIEMAKQDFVKTMWSVRNVGTVPHPRGMLYFADLNAMLNSITPAWDVLNLVNKDKRIRRGAPANNQT